MNERASQALPGSSGRISEGQVRARTPLQRLAGLSLVSGRSAALLLILAAAAVFRLAALNAFGFNSDEAVYAGQAAAIARHPDLVQLFPVFRAHPLLFQFILSLVFSAGISDYAARLAGVLFGLGSVFLVYLLGERMYGQRAGFFAALILALMPYHIIGSRQALLDGPMTFFSLLAMLFIVRYAQEAARGWLYAAGAALGLAVLAKETAVLFWASVFVFFGLVPEIRLRLRDVAGASLVFAAVVLPYPLSILAAGGGGSENASPYLIWQLFRPPNHAPDFYLSTVPHEIGLVVLLCALLGLLLLFRRRSWRETLLLAWIAIPLGFFQLWPTKGFLYLLPLAPPVALLAGRFLGCWFPRTPISVFRRWGIGYHWLAGVVVALSLLYAALPVFLPLGSERVLAGSGGIAGGREAGRWLEAHTADGTTVMTIGPSMANILQFYGHRRALGLSVSPNPLYRNPSYTPIRNPDLEIRRGEIQYLVWDVYSASRSEFFSQKLLAYAQKYNARIVHIESTPAAGIGGSPISQPAIIIFEVRP